MIDDETAARRLTVCRKCEHNRRGRCRKAGRHVQALTRDPEAGCPAQKWPGEADEAEPPHATETNAADVDERPQQPTPARPSRPDWQIVIKSFKRFASLRRLVESIRRHHPHAGIIVADDSLEPGESLPPDGRAVRDTPGVKWLQLPFYVGLAAGRNAAVARARAPVVFNFDDDYVVTRETQLDLMAGALLADENLDVLCGTVRWDGRRAAQWGGRFVWEETDDGTFLLRVCPPDKRWRASDGPAPIRYQRTDLGWNFFAARTDVLRRYPHDEQFKFGVEHLDRFLAFDHARVRVAWTPDCVIGHIPDRPPDYVPYRSAGDLHPVLFRKWNLKRLPDHAARPLHAIPARDSEALIADEGRSDPPNVVVLTIGHTGSSVVSALLTRLGWALPDANRFGESPAVVRLNEAWKRTGRLDTQAAAELLQALPRPWVIKDPRLVPAIRDWMPLLETYRPTLVWLTRDLARVRDSFRRRGELWADVEQTHRLAESIFWEWPWGRLRVDFDRAVAAVGDVVDLRRIGAGLNGWKGTA